MRLNTHKVEIEHQNEHPSWEGTVGQMGWVVGEQWGLGARVGVGTGGKNGCRGGDQNGGGWAGGHYGGGMWWGSEGGEGEARMGWGQGTRMGGEAGGHNGGGKARARMGWGIRIGRQGCWSL